MFSETHLIELEKSFRERLPDSTGMAQLGILLISEVRNNRAALVDAAFPLETLADQIRNKPYTELSPKFQDQVLDIVEKVEQALECRDPVKTIIDMNDELNFIDFDSDACGDNIERREYFQCSVNGDQHIFKFTLHPDTGDFFLYTFLSQEHGFFARLWRGLKYAFGYNSKHGHWDKVEIDRKMAERLHRLSNEALDTMKIKALNSLHNPNI